LARVLVAAAGLNGPPRYYTACAQHARGDVRVVKGDGL
jgi:hypothetical protein